MQKTKSLQNIEEKLDHLEPGTLRYQVLDAARRFKSSWIELGQHLFTVYRDKLFKDWGYLTFEAYCAKEIGIRQPTAFKLLKSYSFLEKEEPAYLKRQNDEDQKPSQIPSYESVNALRLARQNKNIPEPEYDRLRDEVLEAAKEDDVVKEKIRYILKNHVERSPEAKENSKGMLVKRVLTTLKNAQSQMSTLEFPSKITKKMNELVELLEDYQKP